MSLMWRWSIENSAPSSSDSASIYSQCIYSCSVHICLDVVSFLCWPNFVMDLIWMGISSCDKVHRMIGICCAISLYFIIVIYMFPLCFLLLYRFSVSDCTVDWVFLGLLRILIAEAKRVVLLFKFICCRQTIQTQSFKDSF